MALLYFPGLGMVDLIAAVQSLSQPQDPPALMRVGYGLLVGFMLPVAFFTIARNPDLAAAPLQQVFTAALAFAAASVSGALWVGLVGCALLVILGGVVLTLVRGRRTVLRLRRQRVAWPVVVVAALGVTPWFVYAMAMASEQRRDARPYEDFTLGLQGWSALSTFAIAVVLFAFVASLRAPGWRSTVWTTGLAAVVFGLVGIIGQRLPGSPGLLGAIAAMVWGAALIAVGQLSSPHVESIAHRRRPARYETPWTE